MGELFDVWFLPEDPQTVNVLQLELILTSDQNRGTNWLMDWSWVKVFRFSSNTNLLENIPFDLLAPVDFCLMKIFDG